MNVMPHTLKWEVEELKKDVHDPKKNFSEKRQAIEKFEKELADKAGVSLKTFQEFRKLISIQNVKSVAINRQIVAHGVIVSNNAKEACSKKGTKFREDYWTKIFRDYSSCVISLKHQKLIVRRKKLLRQKYKVNSKPTNIAESLLQKELAIKSKQRRRK